MRIREHAQTDVHVQFPILSCFLAAFPSDIIYIGLLSLVVIVTNDDFVVDTAINQYNVEYT